MRKILIAFDGTRYSEAALAFASGLNQISPVLVVGAFMPQTSFANFWAPVAGSQAGPEFIPLAGDDSAEQIQKNIRRFEFYCIDHGMEHRVHRDYFDFAIPELKRESRFADLLIVGAQSYYANAGGEPNAFLEEILQEVECPVLLVPDQFEFPVVNILAYDGSESSVYAIKQFAYLLPEFSGSDTTLVFARGDEDERLPDELNVGELAERHFANLSLMRFSPNPAKFFATWLSEKKGAILVSGSYGRTGLRRLFHKSFIAGVISDHRIPIFVAHR